jgi:hypothetical protein
MQFWPRTLYSDSRRAGRSGDWIPVEANFSTPVQTIPGALQPSVKWLPGLSRWYRGRGVVLFTSSGADVKERVELFRGLLKGKFFLVLTAFYGRNSPYSVRPCIYFYTYRSSRSSVNIYENYFCKYEPSCLSWGDRAKAYDHANAFRPHLSTVAHPHPQRRFSSFDRPVVFVTS